MRLADTPAWVTFVILPSVGAFVGAALGNAYGVDLLLQGALAGVVLAAILHKLAGYASWIAWLARHRGSGYGALGGAVWGALLLGAVQVSEIGVVAIGSLLFGAIGAAIGAAAHQGVMRRYRVGPLLGACVMVPMGLQETKVPLDTSLGVAVVVVQMAAIGWALGALLQRGLEEFGVIDPAPLPPERAWAIALAAPLACLNDDSLDELESLALEDDALSLLEEGWGVTDLATARKTLTWLRDEGHRASGGPQILAWDIGRLVQVVRWCVAAGIVDLHEAWSWIDPTVDQVQGAYGSWSDYGEGYCAGCEFWSGEPAEDMRQATRWLLEDATSPWCTLDWKRA